MPLKKSTRSKATASVEEVVDRCSSAFEEVQDAVMAVECGNDAAGSDLRHRRGDRDCGSRIDSCSSSGVDGHRQRTVAALGLREDDAVVAGDRD